MNAPFLSRRMRIFSYLCLLVAFAAGMYYGLTA